MTSQCKIPTVSHILADFIILSAPDADLAPRGVSTFLQLAKDIKIPIQESKTCLPSTCALVHGMARDTKDNFLGKRLFPSTTTMVVQFLSTRWTILWPSTITAQLSVVSFVHKLDKKKDPTPSFIIKQLLMGQGNLIRQQTPAYRYSSQSWYTWSLLWAIQVCRYITRRCYDLSTSFVPAHSQPDTIFHIHIYLTWAKSHWIKCPTVQNICSWLLCPTSTSKQAKQLHYVWTVHLHFCPVSALQSFLHLRGSVPAPLFSWVLVNPNGIGLNLPDTYDSLWYGQVYTTVNIPLIASA